MSLRTLTPPLDVLRAFRRHDLTLNDFLMSRIERQPDAQFIAFEGASITYREFGDSVLAIARFLIGRGVRPGDRICVMATNHPNTAVLLFALARIGAVMVPLNPAYGLAEARQVLAHAQPVGMLVSPELLDLVQQALAGEQLQPWIVTTEKVTAHRCISSVIPDDAVDAAAPHADANANADSVCLVIYTSGTTGAPKGVMHAQRSIVLSGEGFVGRMYLQPGERMLCVLPMFHINALMYSLAGAVACGGAFLPVRRFSASSFWDDAVATAATEVNFVGAMAHILCKRPRSEYRRAHRIWRAFAAPVTETVVECFRKDFGIDPLVECYGMSEIPGVLANPFLGPWKIGSLGIVSPHPDPAVPRPEVRIVDEAGCEVRAGATGELAVRTPTLMRGYFRAHAETEAAFRDGWFMTGDLAWQDDDGFFHFVGRSKDIIRRRGENISGAELDGALLAHPDIVDAAAIGVPSAVGEDDILVAVVPRPGAALDARGVQRWMRERLSAVKSPRYVAIVESLPRTATQRVEKYKLRSDSLLRAAAIDLEPATIGDQHHRAGQS